MINYTSEMINKDTEMKTKNPRTKNKRVNLNKLTKVFIAKNFFLLYLY